MHSEVQWLKKDPFMPVFELNQIDTTAPVLEFRHVALSFGDTEVLRDVSFTLHQNELICLTGTAGTGKTVTLMLAMGLLQPDDGQILIYGQEIEHLSEEALLALRSRHLGITFQEDALFTSLSVFDNAAYRLVEQGWPETDIQSAVTEIIDLVGLTEAMWKTPEELSGGMKRRLEIARALVGWPSIMLFDEPTAGLDPVNAKNILDLILQARDLHQTSAIFVSKELHIIPYLASHRAQKDPDSGEVLIVRASPDNLPNTHVMVLADGIMSFWGTAGEFAVSHAASVLPLTHPEQIPHEPEIYIPITIQSIRKPNGDSENS